MMNDRELAEMRREKERARRDVGMPYAGEPDAEPANDKPVTGYFGIALRNMILNLQVGIPHAEILARWDKDRGTDWYTSTKRLDSERTFAGSRTDTVAMTSDRGTGRTTRQIMTLRPGDVFVVHTQGMVDHVNYLFAKHRTGLRVTVLLVQGRQMDAIERMRGYPGRVVIDHAADDHLSQDQRQHIRWHNARLDS